MMYVCLIKMYDSVAAARLARGVSISVVHYTCGAFGVVPNVKSTWKHASPGASVGVDFRVHFTLRCAGAVPNVK